MSDLKPKRKHLAVATMLIVAGLVFATTGLFLNNNNTISADSEPPVPAEPTGVNPPSPEDPSVNPPSPEDPTQPGNFTFPAGWSMISAKQLKGRNLTTLNESGIFLYSYNDPYYPVTEWTIFPGLAADDTTSISLKPVSPLGYYVYNPGTVKTLTLAATTSKTTKRIFGRGWHLFNWTGSEELTRDELLSKITISYSNNTILTGAQAVADENHRASVKIYVVTNQNEIDFDKSVKELTGEDSDTTVSKVPANSYYWFYLRRTKDRANLLGYETPTVSATATTTAEETTSSDTATVTTETEIVPPVPAIPSNTTSAD